MAAQALATRDPNQGCGRARTESRDVQGRKVVEAPAGGDSITRRGRSRRTVGSALGPAPEVLMVRYDGRILSQRPVHDAEASTSRTAPPASDATPSRLEEELRHPGVPQSLPDEARAERVLWQEFRAHVTSFNVALTEVLQLHGGSRSRSSR